MPGSYRRRAPSAEEGKTWFPLARTRYEYRIGLRFRSCRIPGGLRLRKAFWKSRRVSSLELRWRRAIRRSYCFCNSSVPAGAGLAMPRHSVCSFQQRTSAASVLRARPLRRKQGPRRLAGGSSGENTLQERSHHWAVHRPHARTSFRLGIYLIEGGVDPGWSSGDRSKWVRCICAPNQATAIRIEQRKTLGPEISGRGIATRRHIGHRS